ncbi:MAG: hypothetical protein OHK0048_20350 [Rhodoferax sp.]
MQNLLGRWPVLWRLTLTSGAAVLTFAVFTVWLWLSMDRLRDDASQALTEDVQWALLAKDMQRNVVQVQQFLYDVSATRALDGLDDGFAQAQAAQQAFLQGLQRFELRAQAMRNTPQQQQLAQIRTDFDAFYRLGVDMAKAYVDLGPAGGYLHMETFDKASTALQQGIGTLVDERVKALADSGQRVILETTQLRLGALGVVAISGLLVMSLGWFAARSILDPLAQGVAVAERVAQGKFIHAHESDGQDELSRLLRALNAMQARLAEVIGPVRQGSDLVASAATQIAQGNHDLSGRTEGQASALQRTSAAMEQLTAQVSQNADSARQAHVLVQEASSVANQAGQVVGEAVHSMHDIQNVSRRIGDITSVIDGIAFQTNILALNAAVEAARAGEQGRGFAVVATEVRALAGRSAEAAREIKTLIEQTLQRVTQGCELVDRAGARMQDVVQAIHRVDQIVSDINTASAQQANAVAEIGQSVSQMDQATQQNAALVEEMASAASHLRQQAHALVDAISVFQVEDADTGHSLLASPSAARLGRS